MATRLFPVPLSGEGGLLRQLTKMVLATALPRASNVNLTGQSAG